MAMKQRVIVVKVGGAVVEDSRQLECLLDNFKAIEGRKVLVHGGGRRATKVASDLGIETKMVDGRRITDSKMLEVATMVYGGLVNKNIVAGLQARGTDAIGLTGADANLILSHKRPLKNGIDYGFVGDVDKADGQKLSSLIESGFVPVLAPLTHDGKGHLLNTNADTIAAEAAKSLAGLYDVWLIYGFEKKGVLGNPDDENSVIPKINRQSFGQLVANGTVAGGMIPKIENALEAVDNGVSRVVITLASEIDGTKGTIISK